MSPQNVISIINTSLMKSVMIMLALVLLLSFVTSAIAQENVVAAEQNETTVLLQAQGPTDPTELESFLDSLLAQELEEYHIAGAAVSVVKDGKLFFTKGYGYADIEKKFPLTPNRRSFALVHLARRSQQRQ